MTICKPDHLTTRHDWTIQIPDLSGIQMVTLFESHHIFYQMLILIFPPNFRSNSTAAGRTTRPTTAASARRKCSTSSSSGRTRHPTSCTAYSAQERTSQTWGAGSAWRSTPWLNCARFMMIFSWQVPQVQIQLQISH